MIALILAVALAQANAQDQVYNENGPINELPSDAPVLLGVHGGTVDVLEGSTFQTFTVPAGVYLNELAFENLSRRVAKFQQDVAGLTVENKELKKSIDEAYEARNEAKMGALKLAGIGLAIGAAIGAGAMLMFHK